MTRANNWRSIGRISWRIVSFKSFNVRGLLCKHAISNTPKGKKLHIEKSVERGEHGTSPKREMRCPGNTNTRCSTGQVSIATEVANPEEKNADHLVPPAAYLLSTTHLKYVRFPWVTLYIYAMAKAAFNKKRTLFTSTLDLELRKKLVKCYIWSIALYGAETWTLRAVDQKHLESFEMRYWRRVERSVGLIM